MPKFCTFLLFRLMSVIFVQTWFVPDETWQVTEVAHHWTFRFGYLCWEWKERIRSFLYPGLFSLIYYMLYLLRLDFIYLLIHIPRILSSILFAIGDFYMCKLSAKLFGEASSLWVAFCLCSSWFLAYCAPRTLTSCTEMVLFSITLYHYPWNMEKVSLSTKYLMWAGVGCIIRPTLAVFFIPYCVRHLVLCLQKRQLCLHYCLNVFLILLVSVGIDSIFYGELTLVPWNFVKFNVLSGLSSHYGTHPWHWYFTQAIPVMCGLHLVPLVWGIGRHFSKYQSIFLPTLWGILIHSFLAHKEFRFLLPIIPVLLIIVGDSLFLIFKKITNKDGLRSRRKLIAITVLAVPNAIVFLYMGLIHQRGPIDVMTSLRSSTEMVPNPHLLFLTPCHSTPLYSHLHVNMPARFLTCEPNLLNQENYKDEADIFFEEPNIWLTKQLENIQSSTSMPSHIIMFDTLATEVGSYLNANNYTLCEEIFNSHFYEGNRGAYFRIYCKSHYYKNLINF